MVVLTKIERKLFWTKSQINDTKESKQRFSSIKDWMKLEFPEKVVVVIGFWTDPGNILNDSIADSLDFSNATHHIGY